MSKVPAGWIRQTREPSACGGVVSMSKRMVPSAAWMCWLVIGPVRPEKEKRSTAAVWSRVSVRVAEPEPELAAPTCGVSEARKSVPPASEGGGGGGGEAARDDIGAGGDGAPLEARLVGERLEGRGGGELERPLVDRALLARRAGAVDRVVDRRAGRGGGDRDRQRRRVLPRLRGEDRRRRRLAPGPPAASSGIASPSRIARPPASPSDPSSRLLRSRGTDPGAAGRLNHRGGDFLRGAVIGVDISISPEEAWTSARPGGL